MTTCADLAALAGAVLLTTQPVPGRVLSDAIVLAPHATSTAELCYHNHPAQVSRFGDFVLAIDGVAVTVRIETTGDGAERVTILPPVGYWVYPADAADSMVPDGEALTVLIMGG